MFSHRTASGRSTPLRLFASLALLLTISLANTGFIPTGEDRSTEPLGPIVLPIEVLGPNGYTETVSFEVDNARGLNRLSLRLHRLSEGEGSVRINRGTWIRLDNRVLTCAYPESEYGCAGGAYKTIRATLPISGVRSGTNTLEFRHNYRNGSISSGYRVLSFNLSEGDRPGVLPASAFRSDDPSTWRAPRNTSADIQAGRQLWERENHLVESPGSQRIIRASCSNCHAQGGEDLKYFNYSNWSIVSRSEFHGLSRRKAEQIASFIRSLDHPNPGTPWDPPYQPGPGLDSRPAEEWAAGAGLDHVLDRDEDMLPHLFPNGINAEAVATPATMNVREMPVAIQFPDWAEWLPRVHPKDAWGNVFLNHSVYRDYARFEDILAGGVRQAVRSGAVVDQMEDWANEFRQFKKDTGKENYFGGWDSEGVVADYMLGLFQWQAVKTWEIMTTNRGLEEAAPQIYPGVGEPRSWFGRARAVFDTAPHINGPDQREPFPQGNEANNRYYSTAWYQVQMTLNAGNRNGLNIRPQDWKYHLEHIRGNGKYTGVREPLRFFQSYAKMMQMADNARGVGSPSGWHLRHVSPAWLLAQRPGSSKDVFQDMNPALRLQITEAMLTAFMDKMERHGLGEWPRTTGLEGIEPSSFRPTPYSGSGLIFDETTYANHFYRMIPIFDEMGVDPHLLQRIAVWSEAAWPRADWESLYTPPTEPTPPPAPEAEIRLASPTDGATVGVDVELTVAFENPPGPFRRLLVFVDDVRVGSLRDPSFPVSYVVTGLRHGTRQLRVIGVDQEGQKYRSAVVTVEVRRSAPTPPIIEEVPLEQGWNNVTLSVQPTDDRIESVVASIEATLKRVEDDQGRIYDPQDGIRQFATWDPARTYRVKVGSAATLAVEGTPLSDVPRSKSSEAPQATPELFANAPNPFSGSTEIRFSLPESASVTIEVYSAIGRRVAVLAEGFHSAGEHRLTFDASALPPGVYLCRMDAGGTQAVRRMVVVE